MWKAIKLQNGEKFFNEDLMIGGAYNNPKQERDIMVVVDTYNREKRDPPRKHIYKGTLTGYGDGYWLVRWVEEEKNEFGPVSP